MKVWIGIVLVIALSLLLSLGRFAGDRSSSLPAAVRLSGEQAARGLTFIRSEGCVACHSLDGSQGIGPTFLGLYGRREPLSDGTTVRVDAAYLRESIVRPGAKVVAGFDNIMLPYSFEDDELVTVVALLRQLGADFAAEEGDH